MALLFGLLLSRGAMAGALPPPLAITDAGTLQALEQSEPGFALGRMLGADASAGQSNDRLFALPALAAVRRAIDADLARYLAQHRETSPQLSIGVGPSFQVQLFELDRLTSSRTRFVLTGVVNRMDRAYVDPASCGEVRLIYRLQRIGEAAAEAATSLPMTLNVVLRAGAASTCAEFARRWLAIGADQRERAAAWTAPGGPLDQLGPQQLDRIETNLQIAHRPKSQSTDFRTDYLLKTFRYDPATHSFNEALLENQIDRERIVASDQLSRAFRDWILQPAQLAALDRGTILIPEPFLARSAIAKTPAGLGRSDLPSVSPVDVVSALQAAADSGIVLQTVRSPAGFARRLGDITCSGCHQTRGIGGFHFPGADRATPAAAAVPGSPHFVGDQPRRRDILAALRDGHPPDFSRGFADRPQRRGGSPLLGTSYDDGWGAHCYRPSADAADNDPSFAKWGCAAGLSCQPTPDANSRFGMCFVN
jgi:hypothetical protein